MKVSIDTIQKQQYQNRYVNKTNPHNSFKGHGALNVLKAISENFIVTLIVIDFFGMIVPRTAIDTMRNKKELGHLNYDAGRETFLREVINTLAMLFLPGYIAVKLGNKFLYSKNNEHHVNTTLLTDRKTLEKSKNIIDDWLLKKSNQGRTEIDVLELRRDFAKKYLLEEGIPTKFITKTLDYLDATTHMSHTDSMKNKLLGIINSAVVDSKTMTSNNDNIIKNLNAFETTKTEASNTIHKGILKFKEGVRGTFIENLSQEINNGREGLKFFGKNLPFVLRDMFTATDDLIMKTHAISSTQTPIDLKAPINIHTFNTNLNKVYSDIRRFKHIKLFSAIGAVLAYSFLMPKANMYLTELLTGRKDFVGVFGLTDEDLKKTTKESSHAPYDKKA